MPTITIDVNDVDWKVLRWFAADPEEWARNFVRARVQSAKQEIYQTELRRILSDPTITTMPADVDSVVAAADLKMADSHPPLPDMTPPV